MCCATVATRGCSSWRRPFRSVRAFGARAVAGGRAVARAAGSEHVMTLAGQNRGDRQTVTGPAKDRYKWVALANTTAAVFMSQLDGSIVLIALPAIFRGIHLDPLAPGNVSYLLWMIMGYRLVQAVLVVTVGRLGDMFGRVRIYNAGFAVFTLASVLLSFDPFDGGNGAHTLTSGPEEFVGLVGETGSGKSMTAASIMGLVRPPGRIVRGAIRFEGRDLTNLPEHELRRIRGKKISLMVQNAKASLNPLLPVGKQILNVYRVHMQASHKEIERHVRNVLHAVGFDDPERILHSYPGQLSGGMAQRIVITIAIGTSPDLVIADEPTTALDVTVQAQILELIKQRQRELGLAVAFVTHDLGVVASFCQSVKVMYAGRIVEAGVTAEIFANPCHPYNAALQQSIPALHQKGKPLFTIAGLPPDLAQAMPGCPFAPRCAYMLPKCQQAPVRLQVMTGHHETACLRYQQGEISDLRHPLGGDLSHPNVSPVSALGRSPRSGSRRRRSKDASLASGPFAASAFVGRRSPNDRCDRHGDADRPSRSGRPGVARHDRDSQRRAARGGDHQPAGDDDPVGSRER